MFRRLLLAMVLLALPSAAVAAPALAYQAPAGCPEEAAFLDALGEAPGVARLEVVVSQEGADFAGRIRIVAEDGASGAREITGRRCSDVVRALALSARIAIVPPAARVTWDPDAILLLQPECSELLPQACDAALGRLRDALVARGATVVSAGAARCGDIGCMQAEATRTGAGRVVQLELDGQGEHVAVAAHGLSVDDATQDEIFRVHGGDRPFDRIAPLLAQSLIERRHVFTLLHTAALSPTGMLLAGRYGSRSGYGGGGFTGWLDQDRRILRLSLYLLDGLRPLPTEGDRWEIDALDAGWLHPFDHAAISRFVEAGVGVHLLGQYFQNGDHRWTLYKSEASLFPYAGAGVIANRYGRLPVALSVRGGLETATTDGRIAATVAASLDVLVAFHDRHHAEP